jgi:hypothetical protein
MIPAKYCQQMDVKRAFIKGMKTILSLSAVVMLFISGCSTKKPFHAVEVNNPEFIANTAFIGNEDMASPKFKALKEKYQLDTIFHGETDEMKRILLLRHWISTHIKIDNYGPYSGDGSVESILDEAMKGKGYHCGHYTAVQNAILNAYGYVTRCIISDVGVPVDYIVGGGHHAMNEVWSNKYQKWFVCDAKYDYHFEKNGIPLSALEIRDEYFKNKAADITSRIPSENYPELKNITVEQFASIYTWLSWGQYANRYSSPSKINTDHMIVYEDDYFKNHTWLWDGKPHWAYKTGYFNPVKDRKTIEWTPNTIASTVTIDGNRAKIELRSITPNLKSYQVKDLAQGEPEAVTWKDVSNVWETELKQDKNEMIFRAINTAGVTGPEHRIVIER